MRPNNYWQSIVCAFLLISLSVLAQTDNAMLESEWLDLVKRYRGEAIGA